MFIMIRILVLVLICIVFTSMSIFANCDKVTGGACSIEELKKEQEMLDKIKPIDKIFDNDKEIILNDTIKNEIERNGETKTLPTKVKNKKALN